MVNGVEVVRIVLEFAAITVITILAERYLSNSWAFAILSVCLAGLGWVHRDWLTDIAQSHRWFVTATLVVIFAAVGLAVGLWLTKPQTKLPNSTESHDAKSSSELPIPSSPQSSRHSSQHISRAKLSLTFAEDEPFRVVRTPYSYFRVAVRNKGDDSADNVCLRLITIKSRPRDSMYGADFPYPLFTSGTRNECIKINPHDEQLFALAQSWRASDGRLIVSGINKKTAEDAVTDPIGIQEDEVWQLTLRATSANAQPVEMTLEMRPEKQILRVTRVK